MRVHPLKKDLEIHFKNNLEKIRSLCDLFDNGDSHFAQDIAVKLRLLFYNSSSSKSLIKQLKLEHIHFFDSCLTYDPNNLVTHLGLTAMYINSPKSEMKYVPMGKEVKGKLVSFDNWWDSKKVIVDSLNNAFTRKKLILELANTDGGAHVDSLKEDYYKLSKDNTGGWMIKLKITGNKIPFNDPVPPSIRQIAFEVIKTFESIDITSESKLRT